MRFYALRSASALLAAQEGGAREGGDAQQRQPQREAGGIAGRGAGLAGFTGTGLIAGIGRAAGGIAVDGRAADVALAVVIGVRVAERRDLARQHVAAGAGAALDAGRRARRGLGDRPLAVIMRVLGADHMGEGDDKLGKMLMKGFVYALTQLEELPQTILLFNSGAYLSCEGSDSVEDLKSMEAQGVEVMTCGTCLNHYGLTEKLAVGSVTNMYVIAQTMMEADHIVKP